MECIVCGIHEYVLLFIRSEGGLNRNNRVVSVQLSGYNSSSECSFLL